MMHTRGMTVITHPNGTVPPIRKFRMGSRNGSTYQAAQWVWDQLDATEYRDAMELADHAATRYRIKPASVRSYLYGLAAEGRLESAPGIRDVAVVRQGRSFTSRRKVKFHRIVPQ